MDGFLILPSIFIFFVKKPNARASILAIENTIGKNISAICNETLQLFWKIYWYMYNFSWNEGVWRVGLVYTRICNSSCSPNRYCFPLLICSSFCFSLSYLFLFLFYCHFLKLAYATVINIAIDFKVIISWNDIFRTIRFFEWRHLPFSLYSVEDARSTEKPNLICKLSGCFYVTD